MADKLTLDRQAMKDSATSHLRIYVGGLTENATVDDLYDHFIQYGKINGIVVNRNFGFVQFDTEASAKQAIGQANGSNFQGRNINVRASQKNPEKSSAISREDGRVEDVEVIETPVAAKRRRCRPLVRRRRRKAIDTPTEVVVVQPEIPPAVALTDNLPINNDDGGDDHYDNYGNYIGDKNSRHGDYREEEYDDGYQGQGGWNDRGDRGRGRGMRGRGRGARGRGAPGYRERSPAPRGQYYREEEYDDGYRGQGGWNDRGDRGRGRGLRGRGQGARGRGARGYRERSPAPRGQYYREEEYDDGYQGQGGWNDRGDRGRGRGMRGRGRGARGRGAPGYRERSPAPRGQYYREEEYDDGYRGQGGWNDRGDRGRGRGLRGRGQGARGRGARGYRERSPAPRGQYYREEEYDDGYQGQGGWNDRGDRGRGRGMRGRGRGARGRGAPGYRERSPAPRGQYYREEEYDDGYQGQGGWNDRGDRGRGRGMRGRGRGARGRGAPGYRERSPAPRGQYYREEEYDDGYQGQGGGNDRGDRGRGRGMRGRGRGVRGRAAPGYRERSPAPRGQYYREEEYDDGYQGQERARGPREGARDARAGTGRAGTGRARVPGALACTQRSVLSGGGIRRRLPGAGGWNERGDRSPAPRAEWPEPRGYDRERYSQPRPDYPRPVPVNERNDCEIIVVSKALTEYAEYIEGRLKRLGIVVDLLFPMEDVPIGKVLGNIASRGCLYAILVMPQNQEHRSLTLNILHGLPQEHRNMPIEDALQLLSRNFQEVQRGGPSGREAVYALLGQLADGRSLTALQYDKVIEYLQERKEQQVKIEVGEPLPTATTKTESDLQQRILSILNDKKPEPAPAPPAPPAQSKLLNDPTVRKALDSILQKFT